MYDNAHMYALPWTPGENCASAKWPLFPRAAKQGAPVCMTDVCELQAGPPGIAGRGSRNGRSRSPATVVVKIHERPGLSRANPAEKLTRHCGSEEPARAGVQACTPRPRNLSSRGRRAEKTASRAVGFATMYVARLTADRAAAKRALVKRALREVASLRAPVSFP